MYRCSNGGEHFGVLFRAVDNFSVDADTFDRLAESARKRGYVGAILTDNQLPLIGQ